MLKTLIETIAKATDGQRAVQAATTINQYDCLFTNSAFRRSSEWLVEQWAGAGMVDGEVVELPADGKTRMQDWTMPLEFECDSAELRVSSPVDKLLCSRDVEPRAVAMGSAPTNGPVTGPVVEYEEGKAIPAGAFVVTDQHPSKVIVAAGEAKAAAVVTSFVVKGYAPHRTMWINGISVEPGCWAVLADRQPLVPIFVITPNAHEELRQLLAANKTVELTGRIDGSIGAGTLPVATAVLPGEDREHEILIMAHGQEAGANDNASGVGAIVEAARVLGQLIADGVLPKPKRSIRWFITNECYGTVGLFSQRPELGKLGVAGLYLDTVGDAGRPDYPLKLHRVGAVSPNVCNALAGLVLKNLPEDIAKIYHWIFENEMPLADHMVSDPMVGIPTPWLGRAQEFPQWHCSDDVPSLLDPATMKGSSLVAAVFAYFLANAGDAEATWLAKAMVPELEAELADRVNADVPHSEAFWRWGLKRNLLQAARFAETDAGRDAVMAVADGWQAEEFTPAGTTELDDPRAASLVPVRKTWGTVTFESIPVEKRTYGSPRWSVHVNGAWYWADGTHTIAQLAELTRLEENGKLQKGLVGLFELAAEAGICELKQR